MSEPAAASDSPSRYVVGIDLGTTNCALASVDTAEPVARGASPAIVTFEVPQLTAPGTVEARSLLPSFVYLPRPGELPASALRLPWGESEDVVGMLAARRAAELPVESGHNLGTLLVVAGQDDARVFLNGKLQRQLMIQNAGAAGRGPVFVSPTGGPVLGSGYG